MKYIVMKIPKLFNASDWFKLLALKSLGPLTERTLNFFICKFCCQSELGMLLTEEILDRKQLKKRNQLIIDLCGTGLALHSK